MTTWTPEAVVERVQDLGVALRVNDQGGIMAKPAGRLTTDLKSAIREHKAQIVDLLTPPTRVRSLTDEAAEMAPVVHITLRHTGDDDESLDRLRTLFAILDQHPGANRIHLRIIEAEGPGAVVERRAWASPDLRRALADLLVQWAGPMLKV